MSTYSFVVKALPPENPDHVFIGVFLDGKLAREWRIPKATAAAFYNDLGDALKEMK